MSAASRLAPTSALAEADHWRCCLSDGAAEEAGLTVGDYVLAVNGTDVTSIPHSEAANLARQGRWGSPEACPNPQQSLTSLTLQVQIF